MDVTGSYRFAAPPSVVWALLNDPDELASCLPGCERLEPLGGDRYKAELSVSVAAISGHYTAIVTILDKEPPKSYRLVVEGTGKAGLPLTQSCGAISALARPKPYAIVG